MPTLEHNIQYILPIMSKLPSPNTKGASRAGKMDTQHYTKERLNNMLPIALRAIAITENFSVEGGSKEIIHWLIENLTGRKIKN